MSIKLIVGLCNPGREYLNTRHNAGLWLIEKIAKTYPAKFHTEMRFKGQVAGITVADRECRLLIPITFMNLSGQAVKALAHFYKIDVPEILVAHDELDFPAGVIRLKQGGSSAGHNGLKDIAAHLHSPDFFRLRIGIGYPQDRAQVSDYVLSTPSKHDKQLIHEAIDRFIPLLPDLLEGKTQKVMQMLHTE